MKEYVRSEKIFPDPTENCRPSAIGQRTYADYESRQNQNSCRQSFGLARYYNVSVDYISGASNVKTKYPTK